MSGSDGWDGFSLLNGAERLRGTAANFSVRDLIINRYTNIITRETRHNVGGRFTTSSGNKGYKRVRVHKEDNT